MNLTYICCVLSVTFHSPCRAPCDTLLRLLVWRRGMQVSSYRGDCICIIVYMFVSSCKMLLAIYKFPFPQVPCLTTYLTPPPPPPPPLSLMCYRYSICSMCQICHILTCFAVCHLCSISFTMITVYCWLSQVFVFSVCHLLCMYLLFVLSKPCISAVPCICIYKVLPSQYLLYAPSNFQDPFPSVALRSLTLTSAHHKSTHRHQYIWGNVILMDAWPY